jgi:hypothetical protein
MQHQNDAHASEQRPQQVMRPGEVQGVEAGANDVVAERGHEGLGRVRWSSGILPATAEKTVSPVVARRQAKFMIANRISKLTPPQVFVFTAGGSCSWVGRARPSSAAPHPGSCPEHACTKAARRGRIML